MELTELKPIKIKLTYHPDAKDTRMEDIKTEIIEVQYANDVYQWAATRGGRYIRHEIVDDAGRGLRPMLVGELIKLLQELDPASVLYLVLKQTNETYGKVATLKRNTLFPNDIQRQYPVSRGYGGTSIVVSMPDGSYIGKWPKDENGLYKTV